MFAILVGFVFEKMFQYFSHKKSSYIIKLGILGIIFIIPYNNIINKRQKINDDFKKEPIYQLGHFIKIQSSNQTLGNKKVVY